MPLLNIITNVAEEKIPADFNVLLTKQVAQVTGKPESYVVISVTCTKFMTFGGSAHPCAKCYVGSLGNVDASFTSKYTKMLTKYIHDKLDVPNDRICILFSDFAGSHLAFGGSTF